ncbi:MAG: hypothetical protein KAR80_08050 [Rhodospirillaceae bacterium]|nr:hypothetical protein [Rhodospirillaceae bacterium]
MTLRIPNRIQSQFLLLWHATFSGGFIVAYVSEDIYAMHLFAGYLVLAAVIVRVLAGLLARPKSPLSLPNPMAATRIWLDKFRSGGKACNPLLAWIAVALLGSIGLAAATGAIADIIPALEDLHEGIAEFTPVVIFVHMGFVLIKPLKKYLQNPSFSFRIIPSENSR